MSTQSQRSTTMAPSASPSALRLWSTRYPVLAYLILAFVVSWAILAVPFLSKSGIGLLPFDVPYTVFVLLASILGLAGSAFIITALVDGRPACLPHSRHFYRGA